MRKTIFWKNVLPVLLTAVMCCTAVPAYAEDVAVDETYLVEDSEDSDMAVEEPVGAPDSESDLQDDNTDETVEASVDTLFEDSADLDAPEETDYMIATRAYFEGDDEPDYDTTYATKAISYGGSTKLFVTAYETDSDGNKVNDAALSYQWKVPGDSNTVISPDNNTCNVSNLTYFTTITCSITDSNNGASAEVTYDVMVDTGLDVTSECGTENGDHERKVIIDPLATKEYELSVTSSLNGSVKDQTVTYQWYEVDDDGDFYEIDGETSASLKLTDFSASGSYKCTAFDNYGNRREFFFDIVILNGFSVEDQTFTYFATEGQSHTFTIDIASLPKLLDGDYSFCWNGDKSATSSSYSVVMPAGEQKRETYCVISDKYNNSATYTYILVNNKSLAGTLTEDNTLSSDSSEARLYSFIPQGTAKYAIYSTGNADPYCYLLNQDGSFIEENDDADNTLNFNIEVSLAKGTTYYLLIGTYDGGKYDIHIDNQCAHNWKTVTTAATYTTAGEQHEECTICGLVRNSIALPVLEKPATPAPAAPVENITIPKTPASVKAKAKKTKVTVSWKKIKKTKKTKALLKQIKKIEVQYSTDKTFATGVKTKRVSGKKTSVTLKLKKKKTYYIRVRYSDNKGGYSKWSKVKKAKTKK